MMDKKTVVMAFCVGLAFCSLSANVCTWQGGDGKFSDDNWDVAPVSGNGDTLVFDTTRNGNAPITVENDLSEDFDIAKISVAGASDQPGALTLKGKRIYLSATTSAATKVWECGTDALQGPVVTNDAPLRLKGGQIFISRNHVFNGKVVIDDAGSVRLTAKKAYMRATFNGGIYGPNATLENLLGEGGSGGFAEFKSIARLKTLSTSVSGNVKCYTDIYSSGNEINTVKLQYGYVRLMAANALSESAVIQHEEDKYGPGTLYITEDQVVRVVKHNGTRSSSKKLSVLADSSKPCMLVMRPDDNYSFDGSFGNATRTLSLTYDPVGPFVYTLESGGDNLLMGDLVLKGGVFKVTGATSFSKVKRLVVRKGAVLDLTDCTAATPINAVAALVIDNGALLKLPEDYELTLASVTVNGVPLKADVYTPSESWLQNGRVRTTGTAAEAGATYWTNLEGGAWADASNWTAGIPDSGMSVAHVDKSGASYEVQVSDCTLQTGTIVIGNDYDDTTTLRLSGDVAFAGSSQIRLASGGVVAQTSGKGTFASHAAQPVVNAGGCWRIGGTATQTFNGYGDSLFTINEGGSLEVAGESVATFVNDRNTWDECLRLSGGRITVVGSGQLLFNASQNGEPHPFHSGEISISDSAVLRVPRLALATDAGKTVRISVTNNAICRTSALLTGLSVGTHAVLDLGSSETMNCGERVLLGVNASSLTETGIHAGSAVSMGSHYGLWLGSIHDKLDAVTCCPTSIVTIAGTLTTVSDYYGNSNVDHGNEHFGALIGGAAVRPAGTYSCWCRGVVNVQPGGLFEHQYGLLSVGIGCGEGEINVCGGELRKTQSQGYVLIGMGGGRGLVSVTEGGYASFASPMYVGGVAMSEIGRSWANFPDDSLSATGELRVTDGSLEARKSVWLGARGTGLMDIGASGQVTVRENLSVEGAGRGVIRISADPETIGSLAVDGDLTLGAGSKVLVDLSSYAGSTRKTLISVKGTMTGVSSGSIEVVQPGDEYVVRVSNDRVSVSPRRGLVLIFR